MLRQPDCVELCVIRSMAGERDRRLLLWEDAEMMGSASFLDRMLAAQDLNILKEIILLAFKERMRDTYASGVLVEQSVQWIKYQMDCWVKYFTCTHNLNIRPYLLEAGFYDPAAPPATLSGPLPLPYYTLCSVGVIPDPGVPPITPWPPDCTIPGPDYWIDQVIDASELAGIVTGAEAILVLVISDQDNLNLAEAPINEMTVWDGFQWNPTGPLAPGLTFQVLNSDEFLVVLGDGTIAPWFPGVILEVNNQVDPCVVTLISTHPALSAIGSRQIVVEVSQDNGATWQVFYSGSEQGLATSITVANDQCVEYDLARVRYSGSGCVWGPFSTTIINEPVPPVDCTITPDHVAIAVDASFEASAVAGVNYYIVSDDTNALNLWASHVGETVTDAVFVVPVLNDLIEDPNTTLFWIALASGPALYHTPIQATELWNQYYLESLSPSLHALPGRSLLVELFDGSVWTPIYNGPESVFVVPQILPGTAGAQGIRSSYTTTFVNGTCTYGPFAGNDLSAEFFHLISNRAGTVLLPNFQISMVASNGDWRYRLWDGVEGAVNTFLSIPVPTTGLYSGTTPKEVLGWPVLNPGDTLPAGVFTSISAASQGLILADITRLANLGVVNITGNPLLTSLPMHPSAEPTNVIVNDNGLTTLVIPGTSLLTLQGNNNQVSVLDLDPFLSLNSVIFTNNNLATVSMLLNVAAVTINFRGNNLTSFNPVNNVLCTSLNLFDNLINAPVNVSTLTVLQTLILSSNAIPSQATAGPAAALQDFQIENNSLIAGGLNVTTNTGLLKLLTTNNPALGDITGLATCVLLQELRCANCGITTIPATLTALQKLYAGDNAGLVAVGLPTYTALVECDLNDCALTVADPTACPNLQYLNLSGNIIAAGVVNTTLNAALRSVGLVGCGLNSHDPTGNALLEELYLGNDPGITVMPNLANNLVLRIYESPGCPVTTFAIASTVVRQINILGAACPTINVSGKAQLNRLQVGSNSVCTTLNFANCAVNDIVMNAMPALTDVDARNNALPQVMSDHVVSSLPAGAPPGSLCRLEGGTNAIPNPALVAAKPNWIITTN